MSPLLRSVLDLSGPIAGQLAAFAAAVLSVFVLYLGVAMAAALFHRNREQRAVALKIFRDLLSMFRRAR